ncbi:PepSY domain-containing protein [Streptomyces sp. C11-1]|uniref:PepSY domain-containing protein n=1 Tax=Streptomyces durocortorensis TaxID=2811104 RepID=A0ABY9VNL8_9ACTN|nr:PepSY domain-containing protein [Streptomyces durocortorensis]WNF25423.1 PepSY domain-containing protein [Streptomyces durocortorensis]
MRLEPRRKNSASLRSRNLTMVGALGMAAAAAVLLTGCGQSADNATSAATSEAAKVLPQQQTTTPSATAELTEEQQERKEVLDATKVTFDDAATTAVGEVAGGKLVDLDLEGVDDDDRDESPSPTATGSPTGTASPTGTSSPTASPGAEGPVWVAEVAERDGTIHTVRINAVDGKVTEARVDADQDTEDKEQTVEWLSQATQTPQQAAKVATEKKKGTVTSVSLEDNNGDGVIWAVDVVGSDWKRTTFDVDAKTDAIVREENDDY